MSESQSIRSGAGPSWRRGTKQDSTRPCDSEALCFPAASGPSKQHLTKETRLQKGRFWSKSFINKLEALSSPAPNWDQVSGDAHRESTTWPPDKAFPSSSFLSDFSTQTITNTMQNQLHSTPRRRPCCSRGGWKRAPRMPPLCRDHPTGSSLTLWCPEPGLPSRGKHTLGFTVNSGWSLRCSANTLDQGAGCWPRRHSYQTSRDGSAHRDGWMSEDSPPGYQLKLARGFGTGIPGRSWRQGGGAGWGGLSEGARRPVLSANVC